MNTNPFDQMYEGTPPWEIGRPQKMVADLVDRGRVRGRVLDLGCGTGENALLCAARGLEVVGVDSSPRAIEMARAKAKGRDLRVRFLVQDALEISAVGETFDTVIDSGLFHVFSDESRRLYARELARVMRTGSSLYVLCFSEEEPDWGGPRRVTRRELRETFGPPYAIEAIERVRYETLVHKDGARAWLASVVYIGRAVSTRN
jgi:ubiquinone/menaquinone biosynthesis C-methylase UbiE